MPKYGHNKNSSSRMKDLTAAEIAKQRKVEEKMAELFTAADLVMVGELDTAAQLNEGLASYLSGADDKIVTRSMKTTSAPGIKNKLEKMGIETLRFIPEGSGRGRWAVAPGSIAKFYKEIAPRTPVLTEKFDALVRDLSAEDLGMLRRPQKVVEYHKVRMVDLNADDEQGSRAHYIMRLETAKAETLFALAEAIEQKIAAARRSIADRLHKKRTGPKDTQRS